MKVETAKTIRFILLIIACIALFRGIVLSVDAGKEAARDTSNIIITVTDKKSYYNEHESSYGNGYYHIDLTYSITNKTKVGWKYLQVIAHVYDKNGKSLGTINSDFGTAYGPLDLNLGVGETVTNKVSLKDNQPDDFFAALYQYNLSDLKFEFDITQGTYYED